MFADNVVALSLLIAFLWSLIPIIYKLVLKEVPPETVFFCFYFFSFLIVTIIFISRRKKIKWQPEKFTWKSFLLFVGIIFIGSIITNYFYFHTLQKNQAYLVTVLTAVYPIMTAIIAYLFLKEEINLKSWVGIILVVIGLVIIIPKTSNGV